MATINKLKEKHQRTDDDAIIKEMISTGNDNIVRDSSINNIFSYAEEMGYISKREFGGHYSYKISQELDKPSCGECGENSMPFNININTFETVTSEFDSELHELKVNYADAEQANKYNVKKYLAVILRSRIAE